MQFLGGLSPVHNALLDLSARLKAWQLRLHAALVISLHQVLKNVKCASQDSFVTRRQFHRLPKSQQLVQVFTVWLQQFISQEPVPRVTTVSQAPFTRLLALLVLIRPGIKPHQPRVLVCQPVLTTMRLLK